jgi:hypothetical protein
LLLLLLLPEHHEPHHQSCPMYSQLLSFLLSLWPVACMHLLIFNASTHLAITDAPGSASAGDAAVPA